MNVTADRLGRTVVVVTDEEAEQLRAARDNGWTDVPGMNHGTSAPVPLEHPAHAILDRIAAVVATDSPDEREREQAERLNLYVFMVGASAWNAEVSSWVPGRLPITSSAHRHGRWVFAG